MSTSSRSIRLFSMVLLALAFLCLTLSAALAEDAAPKLGPNLVRNGDFSQGSKVPSGWHWGTTLGCEGAAALDPAVTHDDHPSVRLSRTTAFEPESYAGLATLVTDVQPGTEYLIRLWAKGQGVGAAWFGGGTNWSTRQSFPTGDFDWRPFELQWVAPANVNVFELRLNLDSPAEALWVTEVGFQSLGAVAAGPIKNPGKAYSAPVPYGAYPYGPYYYPYPWYDTPWPEYNLWPSWDFGLGLYWGGRGDRDRDHWGGRPPGGGGRPGGRPGGGDGGWHGGGGDGGHGGSGGHDKGVGGFQGGSGGGGPIGHK
jgi:hypothetical protein